MPASFAATDVCDMFGLPTVAPPARFDSVSTDTRTLAPGSLFVALKGENHDGTRFVADARGRGAAGAVVPRDAELSDVPRDFPVFGVPDTRRALGDLAALHRRRAQARVVGITGSSGKTTVKEMISRALSEERTVYATEGNLNNQVGVPLTILAAPDEADVWVIELGSNAPGEIRRLTEVAAPDDAVITTVGPAHLDGFGDVAGVLAEKMDIVRGASVAGGVVVGELPAELPHAAREVRPDTVVAGLGSDADFHPHTFETGAHSASFEKDGVRFVVPVGGEHHLRDLLIAAAVAELNGVSPGSAARGLADYRAHGMRGELREMGYLTVLADCYNANPESFAAAIDFCAASFPGARLTAVVGSMLELGDQSAAAHGEIADRMLDAGFDLVIVTGAFSAAFAEAGRDVASATIVAADGPDAAADALLVRLTGSELVLVKGSRGARLEGVVDRLQARFGKGNA